MSNLFDILNTVSNALKDDQGFDMAELDKAVADLHLKLTEPKWAIEDEALRQECEKLVVAWAAQRYLSRDDAQVTDLAASRPPQGAEPVKSAITPPPQANDKELEDKLWQIAATPMSAYTSFREHHQDFVNQVMALIHKDRAAYAEILEPLIDPDDCQWDHNHSCQAHGHFYLDQSELCPVEKAKRWLASHQKEKEV